MDPVSAELIAMLARKVFARQSANPSLLGHAGDFLLGPGKIAEGIKNLLDMGDLKLGAATDVSDFHDALVDKVIETVKRIQQETPGLDVDGVLGRQTLMHLLKRVFGHYNRPIESLPPSTTHSAPGAGKNELRYWIEKGRLPEVAGLDQTQVLQLLSEAWGSWKEVCNLDAKHAKSPEEANVIIRLRHLTDQPQSVLAVADVGPPRGFQLDLSFDLAEQWTAKKFQATAAHEIGHLLGLKHSSVPRQLMNDTLHDDIMVPMDDDIRAAVAIWGAS